MRIAGLLHLCEYEPTDKVTAATTAKAIKIAEWAESQAERAFGAFAAENENKTAKYIVKRLREKGSQEMSKREIRRISHKSKDEIEPLLELLEDHGYIKEKYSEKAKHSKSKIVYLINPYIFE